MVHISDILASVTPTQQRRRSSPQVVEFDYERVDWESVPKDKLVDDQEELAVWGGYPGSYDTVSADGFRGVRGYFDSSLSEANVVYVTDTGLYVYDFVFDEVRESTLQSEVLLVLSELSRQGIVEGLRPTEEVPPPDFPEHLEFHDSIQEYSVEEQGGELVCKVVVDEATSRSSIATAVRTVDGIVYPRPERVEVVSGDGT